MGRGERGEAGGESEKIHFFRNTHANGSCCQGYSICLREAMSWGWRAEKVSRDHTYSQQATVDTLLWGSTNTITVSSLSVSLDTVVMVSDVIHLYTSSCSNNIATIACMY